MLQKILQMCKIPDTFVRIFDLVLTSLESTSLCKSNDSLLICYEYHSALEIILAVKISEPGNEKSYYLDFKNANKAAISSSLAAVEWDQAFEKSCVDECVFLFYSVLYDAVDRYVPLCKVRKNKYLVYFSRDLVKLLAEKREAQYRNKVLGR